MQQVIICPGQENSNPDTTELNNFLTAYYNAKVISVTPYNSNDSCNKFGFIAVVEYGKD